MLIASGFFYPPLPVGGVWHNWHILATRYNPVPKADISNQSQHNSTLTQNRYYRLIKEGCEMKLTWHLSYLNSRWVFRWLCIRNDESGCEDGNLALSSISSLSFEGE